jgi:predicted alpha/beta hydrolase family esterase
MRMSSSASFLIVHGAYGDPTENWFPWLEQKLKKRGDVRIPQFPAGERQNLDAWLAVADQTLANISPRNTILIGHSSGALLTLRMAEKTRQPFRAVCAVCPFARDLGHADFDPLNASFIYPAFDWQAVMRGAGTMICFAGDDDPYVPLAYSKEVAEKASAAFVIVKKGGHLNAEAGYREFPLLLEKIQQLL